MLDIPSISAVVATIGVVVGVVFTIEEVRDLVKTRQTDLVMGLYSTFGSKEFLESCGRLQEASLDYNRFLKEHGWSDVIVVGTFFEGIGVLLHRKLIDVGLVDELFSEPISLQWKIMKPIIEKDRERLGQPRIYEWFEYLANQMQKREQRLQQTQQ